MFSSPWALPATPLTNTGFSNLFAIMALTTRDLGTANVAQVVQFMQDLKLLLGNPDLLLDD